MNLVNKKHLIRLETRERRSKISDFLKGRARCRFEVCPKLTRDKVRERGLPQPRLPIEKKVVTGFFALFRGAEHNLKIFLDLFLTNVFFPRPGPEENLDRDAFGIEWSFHF